MTVVAAADATAAGEVAPRASHRSYGRYVLGKIGGSAASLAFVVVFNFFLFRVLPGDPAHTLGRGRLTSPEAIAEFNKTYRLDEPLPKQFLTYLGNLLHGDLGPALTSKVPVSQLLMDRIWPTLLLVGTSTILATVLGVWLGVNQAWKRGSLMDKSTTWTSLVLYSMPEWWLGMVFIAILSTGPGPLPALFPTGGLHTDSAHPQLLDTVWHLTLPVITLTLAYLADYSLIMRSAMLDELSEDYLTTARAKGLRDLRVRNRHAARNALLPTATLIALNLGFVVAGAITVETVFSIPGLGLLAVEALRGPDLWLLQGTFLIASAGVIVANLLANLLYGVLDPRVRA